MPRSGFGSRYFSDADAILAAWHERQVAGHIGRLSSLTEGEGSALERLEALLTVYAQAQHAQPRDEIGAALHGREHVAEARQRLAEFVSELIGEAAADGLVRADVNADELAEYCLHAMAAAGELRSKAAVRRLVRVTMAGLQPPQIPPAMCGESG